MRISNIRSCCLAACVFFGAQSLSDVAREEAERRRRIDQQGIESKVIESGDPRTNREEHRASSSQSSDRQTGSRGEKPSSGDRASVRSYRTKLQKLDRTIRQDEERLELKRRRLESERWALPKPGRLSAGNKSADVQEKLKREIDELQIKLRELRRERTETYAEGLRLGFLPGELDGKGVVP
jgi:hypothetical protein